MRKLMRGRPSPGLVVAGLALMVALGGTAVGLPGKNSVDKNDIQKNAVKSKHIKNGQVKPKDLNAKSLSPRAYAFVTADNQVDEAKSRGITDEMVNLDDEWYCFYNLGFTPKHVQVTVDLLSVTGDTVAQASLGTNATCDGTDEQATVRMVDASGNINVPSGDFFVAFFE